MTVEPPERPVTRIPHTVHGDGSIHDWTRIRIGPVRRTVAEARLVLEAVGIANRIAEHVDGYALLVPHDQVHRAEEELTSYQQELINQPPPPQLAVPVDKGLWGIAGFLLVIWAVPFLQGQAEFGADMLRAGRMQAGLVEAGEWWRTFTALTLHGDSGHILSNSAFGAFFGIYVARGLGSGLGWLLVLVAGAMGNGANAMLQADAFSSIGASTATFAALGIFAAVTWVRGEIRRGRGWRRSVAPLFAGFALVVWTGTGGENTDVAAHFTGFAAGVLLGCIAGKLPRSALSLPVQCAAGVIGLAIPVLTWILALAGGMPA